jgi:hypothetical protein
MKEGSLFYSYDVVIHRLLQGEDHPFDPYIEAG